MGIKKEKYYFVCFGCAAFLSINTTAGFNIARKGAKRSNENRLLSKDLFCSGSEIVLKGLKVIT